LREFEFSVTEWRRNRKVGRGTKIVKRRTEMDIVERRRELFMMR
jgi:hypothetical protein